MRIEAQEATINISKLLSSTHDGDLDGKEKYYTIFEFEVVISTVVIHSKALSTL